LKQNFRRIIITSTCSRYDALSIWRTGGGTLTQPEAQFIPKINWTPAEKKTARKAFDKAFEAQCAAITAEVNRMLTSLATPCDIWRVHDYLSEHRRSVDRIYDYRYSVLHLVFARLLRDGWLSEADLVGLQKDKIDDIKHIAAI
jgi:hypothetical protein